MKKACAIAALLYIIGLPMIALSAPCPANNPFSQNSIPMQGPDPTGLGGWPISVVSACPLDVNIVAGGGSCVTQCTSPWIVGFGGVSQPVNVQNFPASQTINGTVTVSNPTSSCVTQCTSPWVVSGTVAATQSGAWTVGVNNFPATQPVSGTVTSNQGTNPWIVAGNHTPSDAYVTPTDAVNTTDILTVYNGTTQDRNRTANSAAGTTGTGVPASGVMGFDGTNYQRLLTLVSSGVLRVAAGSTATDSSNALGTTIQDSGGTSRPFASLGYIYSPKLAASTRNRNVEVYKTVQATVAGNTALWTPAAGTKFRLMRYKIEVTDNATTAGGGVVTIDLKDGAATTNQTCDVFVPAVALNNSGNLYGGGWIDLGNGVISAAANNVLNVNLSAALATGNVRVICAGTEE